MFQNFLPRVFVVAGSQRWLADTHRRRCLSGKSPHVRNTEPPTG
jgi:hypothetical protein